VSIGAGFGIIRAPVEQLVQDVIGARGVRDHDRRDRETFDLLQQDEATEVLDLLLVATGAWTEDPVWMVAERNEEVHHDGLPREAVQELDRLLDRLGHHDRDLERLGEDPGHHHDVVGLVVHEQDAGRGAGRHRGGHRHSIRSKSQVFFTLSPSATSRSKVRRRPSLATMDTV
jgi:hypothetical protein